MSPSPGDVRAPVVVFEEGAIFRGYLPSPPLRASVELLWMTSGLGQPGTERILPNGVFELIINLGAPQRVVHDSGFTRFRRAWVAGLQRGPLDIASEHDTHLVGIRFRPGGAAAILGLPVHELTDTVIDWETPWVAELRERLLDRTSDGERLALVEASLQRVQRRTPDRRVAHALGAMGAAPAGLGVGRLAQTLGCSHKHLIDLFRREVGLTPKALQRILRFQAVLRAVNQGRPTSWTELAHRHGYADQAHMNHDFRTLAGLPPGAYLGARTADPNHLVVR